MSKKIHVLVVETDDLYGPNSKLSRATSEQLSHAAPFIRRYLPPVIPMVVSGVSRAEKEASLKIEITPTHYSPLLSSGLTKTADSDEVMLLTTTRIHPDSLLMPNVKEFLNGLPDDSLIICDSFFLKAAGVCENQFSGLLVRLTQNSTGEYDLESEFDLVAGEPTMVSY